MAPISSILRKLAECGMWMKHHIDKSNGQNVGFCSNTLVGYVDVSKGDIYD